MKDLYVVEFSSNNYAGAPEHCLVWAFDEFDARTCNEMLDYAEEYYREQDEDQLRDEGMYEEFDGFASIDKVSLLKGSDFEQYVDDPTQTDFYPVVNGQF